MARPSSLNPNVTAPLLVSLQENAEIGTACRIAGISPRTFQRWMEIGDDANNVLHAAFRCAVMQCIPIGQRARFERDLAAIEGSVTGPVPQAISIEDIAGEAS